MKFSKVIEGVRVMDPDMPPLSIDTAGCLEAGKLPAYFWRLSDFFEQVLKESGFGTLVNRGSLLSGIHTREANLIILVHFKHSEHLVEIYLSCVGDKPSLARVILAYDAKESASEMLDTIRTSWFKRET
jgi:hypothetical protein